MNLKPIDKMTDDEFDGVLDQIGQNAPDMITLTDFMQTLWELRVKASTNIIELSARLVEDRLELKAPEGVAVHGNEVIIGNHHIIVRWSTA